MANKKLTWLLLGALLLSLCAGCSGSPKKEDTPTTITVWHVYGGQTDSPLNDLIAQFNQTVGKERGINVQVTSVSNTNTIHEAVLASANGEPGSSELPDLFISYPKTVLALPDDSILVDYRDYFSEEELAAFIPAFREEGMIGGRQAILPLAKSTEVLFVNRTLFDRWAVQSGASYDNLTTWEGVYALAEQYAADTGKCFFIHDYHFNYFQVGVESLGEDFFQDDGVRFGPGFERAWEPYARAGLTGGLWLYDGYATEPLRTGDAVVSVASSASVLYYSDTVTYPDNTSEKVTITSMPCPVFEGGDKLVMQRGVGMCTVKSTPEREQAAVTFLKWLTEPACNTRFAVSAGYMPTTQEAFDVYLPQEIQSLTDPKYTALYDAYAKTQPAYEFYVPPQLESYQDLEASFEKNIRLCLLDAREAYLQAGGNNQALLEQLVQESLVQFQQIMSR